jgi:hypothetical protein
MTQEAAQEVVATPTESEALAAGFNDAPLQAEVEVPQEEAKEEVAEEAKPEVVEEVTPETVSITVDEWRAMQARVSEIDNLKAETSRKVDQAMGKYGELNRTIQEIKQKPQGGMTLTKDKLERLRVDYPELAELFAEATPESKQEAPVVDHEEIKRLAEATAAEKYSELVVKNEMRELGRRHKDWGDVVKSEDFAKWVQTLPQEEAQALITSTDADEISAGLDRFKEQRAKAEEAAKAALAKANKQQSASKRLEAAITPTGTAGGPPSLTERDLFLQGFKNP